MIEKIRNNPLFSLFSHMYIHTQFYNVQKYNGIAIKLFLKTIHLSGLTFYFISYLGKPKNVSIKQSAR